MAKVALKLLNDHAAVEFDWQVRRPVQLNCLGSGQGWYALHPM
jgi:hypothetical protein